MSSPATLRKRMVEHQIRSRGVRDPLVLQAMGMVPREAFLPKSMNERAYDDRPLPIDAEQTISQPYIVAYMVEALGLKGGERVLEIGTGSGYAAAVISRIARQVFTIERIAQLAERSAVTLAGLGYDNVVVRHGDGTLGWHDFAPFDAIIVAAAGPEVPNSLRQQLTIGGRLVMPVGKDRRSQELVRITRLSESRFQSEEIADVRFVPLIGTEGWGADETRLPASPAYEGPGTLGREGLLRLIASRCEAFSSAHDADLAPLMNRIGDSRIVLLGESSHGTSEFYTMRDHITRELVARKGFTFVAIEGDWPDVARMDRYVRHLEYPPAEWMSFARFPKWMWRNSEFQVFVEWLRQANQGKPQELRTPIYGLDLYSLFTSIHAVLHYLDRVDPEAAKTARQRYGCLSPWRNDPAAYGQAAQDASFRACEEDVVLMLQHLLAKQNEYVSKDGEDYNDAVHNARLIANAERYYRIMYHGSRASWNLRDGHMFETLKSLLNFHGPQSKAVVWAHNSHVGNAAATEMSAQGETNIGELSRKEFGGELYSIGFGTHAGHLAAATRWDGPVSSMSIMPSHADSYERLFHDTAIPQFFLPLRARGQEQLRALLMQTRLERAIGVIYRPDTELQSHYSQAALPGQFDEFIWFDQTTPVTPLKTKVVTGQPDTYPFGL